MKVVDSDIVVLELPVNCQGRAITLDELRTMLINAGVKFVIKEGKK